MTVLQQSPSYVIGTHILTWLLFNHSRLSARALSAVQAAEAAAAPIFISAITIVELRYLIEKGTVAEQQYQEILGQILDPAMVLTIAPLDLATADKMSQILRLTVPEMPDRIISATALALGLPLVSADTKIRNLKNIPIIW